MRLPEHEERAILLEKKYAEFTFDSMVKYFRKTIGGFPDRRTGSNTQYSIEDAALGAFSVFFTQSPSFLSFQSAMQQTKGKNNAQSLFGITQIPCNNHIRDLMDEVSCRYQKFYPLPLSRNQPIGSVPKVVHRRVL